MKGNLFKTLQQLKLRIDTVQKELREARYEGRAGGGAVTLTISGAGELLDLNVDPSVLSEGAETVSALVKSAFADAHARKELAAGEALKRVGVGPGNPFGTFDEAGKPRSPSTESRVERSSPPSFDRRR